MAEIEHRYTDEVVCPYCGYVHQDSWEINSDSGEYECHECGEEFFYERDVTVTYCTSKLTATEASA